MRLLTIGAMQQQRNSVPKPEPGMTVWFDVNQITGLADNDPVAQWNDLSGNNYHAMQADAGLMPTYKANILNGNPVIRFLTSRMRTSAFASVMAQPNTIFGVWNNVGSGTTAYFDGITSDARHFPHQNDFSFAFFAGTSDTFSLSRPVPYVVITINVNGTGSEIYKNGGLQKVIDVGAQGLGGLTIGSRFEPLGTSNQFHVGDIAEIIIYDRLLTQQEREKVEAYLLTKYGL